MPRFANMAIRDDDVSVKQESMDIDLSEENFPSLSERNLTYHDELHQDHMGGRIIYSPRVQVTSSMGEEIDDILGSAVTNSPVLTENQLYDEQIKSEAVKSKQWFDQEMIKHKKLLDRLTTVESRIPEPGSQAEIQREAEEKAANKKFLKCWYDDDKLSDAVSYGSYNDDDYIDNWSWYVSNSFSKYRANDTTVLVTNDLNFIIGNNNYVECNNVDRINVALKSSQREISKKESYWLLDGGASLHITPHMSDFSSYEAYSEPELIQTAHKNAKAKILGKGSVYIQYNIGSQKRKMMLETCYMPTCSERLLSTGSLKMCGYTESSDKNDTKFFLNKELVLVGQPKRVEGPVHWVKCRIIKQNCAFIINSDIWHQRMAHPSKEVLSKLDQNVKGCKPIRVSTLKQICPGCVQGKMHDQSFTGSEKHTNQPLELIHADLMELPLESYH